MSGAAPRTTAAMSDAGDSGWLVGLFSRRSAGSVCCWCPVFPATKPPLCGVFVRRSGLVRVLVFDGDLEKHLVTVHWWKWRLNSVPVGSCSVRRVLALGVLVCLILFWGGFVTRLFRSVVSVSWCSSVLLVVGCLFSFGVSVSSGFLLAELLACCSVSSLSCGFVKMVMI
jgi:hypothetical protein